MTLQEKQLIRLEYRKQWLLRNAQHFKDQKKIYKKNLQQLWSSPGKAGYTTELVSESEVFVAQQVLPKMGFRNIFLTRDHNHHFLCDILSIDFEGKLCGFDVKLSITADIPSMKLPIIRHLRMRFFIVHVKPDFKFYYVKEMVLGTSRNSSAIARFKEYLGSPQN